ncbi:MAG TPA: T9SS type A sorting domain-containing protein [Flavipsychrobacter sp.]|nr:T9SS type A sorting domain-containing protein [Flavipsychrobacter sp.]
MKKIYSIAILLLPTFVYAKTTGLTLPTFYPHFGSAGTTPSPASNTIRLVGSAQSIFDGTNYQPFDSSVYQYSGGRGGLLDMDYTALFLSFDTSISYEYDAASLSYKYENRYTQQFSNQNNILSRIQEKYTTDGWHNTMKLDYNYDVHNSKLVGTNLNIWVGMWFNNNNYKIYYNANNLIGKVEEVLKHTFLQYDANQNIIERKQYEYTTANGWDSTERYRFSYDAFQRMNSYTLEIYDQGTWKLTQKVDYAFSGNNVTAAYQYSWANKSWKLIQTNSYTYDSQNNKISDESKVLNNGTGNLVNFRKEHWTYNNLNQPTSYYSQTWDATGGNWTAVKGDFYHRYYYEFYFPTSVPEFNADTYFTLYPQPASNIVNIQLRQNAATTKGVVCDLQGKVVKSFSFNNSTTSIPVGDLPSGNYLLRISNNEAYYSKPLIVAR